MIRRSLTAKTHIIDLEVRLLPINFVWLFRHLVFNECRVNQIKFGYNLSKHLVLNELGLPLDQLFSEISPEPVAAASLSQEGKQELELMGRWEMIDVCDALEPMTPVFKGEKETDIQEKEQKESQTQTNPSTGRKGPSRVKVYSHPLKENTT
ncbi:hypothetical protein Tco_0326953 [Tanacetum coccineum]